ncbi:PEP/pyruvate-binding domain-containing protein, partial [Neisseria sp. P0021.S007]
AHNGLSERISEALKQLDVEDVAELGRVGKEIRQWILDTPFPEQLDAEIETAWNKMVADAGGADISVAVRSSATAEDLPDASFAGQQETFLNINGLDNVKEAMHHVFASLYNDRAISYRVHKGFEHDIVALSAGVQRMVRSDSGASGVMFTIDTESGYDQVVFVTSSYGLGENVVQGAVNPDEFYVFKPTLKAGKPAILRKTMGSK